MELLSINLFHAFEILGFGSFFIILARELFQKNWRRVFEIMSCAIFGLILEIGNTYLAHTYYYSQHFFFMIMDVPIAIGLGWAVIIYCAMLLSDQYNIPWHLRPFMDALTAIMLDLSLDVIAIRLGFWHWSIPLDQEWYGVPFENLVGWMLVVFSFSFLVRFIRTLNPKRVMTKAIMLLSPAISYGMLFVGLVIFSLLAILPYQVNNWTTLLSFNYHPDFNMLYNQEVQFWKLIVFTIMLIQTANIVGWALFKYKNRRKWKLDIISFSILSSMHLFFFVTMFTQGIWRDYPIFVLIGISTFIIHCLLHFLPYLNHPGFLYLFRDIKEGVEEKRERAKDLIEASMR